MKLTPKQRKFCDFYIETCNATEAAIKAGYSENTAKEIGYENLTKPHIKVYIDQRMAEKENDRIASQDEILAFLTKVVRGEITEQFAIGIGEGAQEIARKEVTPKDRVKAAELLGKRYALWIEKQQIEGNMGVQIVDDIK